MLRCASASRVRGAGGSGGVILEGQLQADQDSGFLKAAPDGAGGAAVGTGGARGELPGTSSARERSGWWRAALEVLMASSSALAVRAASFLALRVPESAAAARGWSRAALEVPMARLSGL